MFRLQKLLYFLETTFHLRKLNHTSKAQNCRQDSGKGIQVSVFIIYFKKCEAKKIYI